MPKGFRGEKGGFGVSRHKSTSNRFGMSNLKVLRGPKSVGREKTSLFEHNNIIKLLRGKKPICTNQPKPHAIQGVLFINKLNS